MPRQYSPMEVIGVLEYLGWERRPGRGDHVNMNKPGIHDVIAIDMGRREVPRGTLGSILRSAGLTKKQLDRIAGEIL